MPMSGIDSLPIPFQFVCMLTVIASIVEVMFFLASVAMFFFIFGRRLRPDETFDYDTFKVYCSLAKFANPLAVYIYWPARGLRHDPKGIKWLAPRLAHVIWEIVLFFFNFSRVMIIITHSQRRTLCPTVTFMTVVLGYVANGNIAVFTVAGAAIGAVYSASSLKDYVVLMVMPKSQPV